MKRKEVSKKYFFFYHYNSKKKNDFFLFSFFLFFIMATQTTVEDLQQRLKEMEFLLEQEKKKNKSAKITDFVLVTDAPYEDKDYLKRMSGKNGGAFYKGKKFQGWLIPSSHKDELMERYS